MRVNITTYFLLLLSLSIGVDFAQETDDLTPKDLKLPKLED